MLKIPKGASPRMRAFREEGAEAEEASRPAAGQSQPCPELPSGFLAGLVTRHKKLRRRDGHDARVTNRATASRLVDNLLTSVASRARPGGLGVRQSSAAFGRQETAEVTLHSPPAADEVTLHSPPDFAAAAANQSGRNADAEARFAARELGDDFLSMESIEGAQPEQLVGAQSPRATVRREGGSNGALPALEAVTPIEPSPISPGSSELSPPWPTSMSEDILSRDAGRKDPSRLSTSSSGFDTTQDMLRGALLAAEDGAPADAIVTEGTFAFSSSTDLSNVAAEAEAALREHPCIDSLGSASEDRGPSCDNQEGKAGVSRPPAMPRPMALELGEMTGASSSDAQHARAELPFGQQETSVDVAAPAEATASTAATTPVAPHPKATASRLVDTLLSTFTSRSKDSSQTRNSGATSSAGSRNSRQDSASATAGAAGSAHATADPDSSASNAASREQTDDRASASAVPATSEESGIASAGSESLASNVAARVQTAVPHQDEEEQQHIALSGGARADPQNADERSRALPQPDQKTIQAQRRLAAEGLTSCLQRALDVALLRPGIEALWTWLEAERSRAAVLQLQERLDRKASARRRADAECQADVASKHVADGAAGDVENGRLVALEGRIEDIATGKLDALEGRIEVISTQLQSSQQETTRRLEVISTQLESAAASPAAARQAEPTEETPALPSASPHKAEPAPVSDASASVLTAVQPGLAQLPAAQLPRANSTGGRPRPSSAIATVGRTLPNLLGGGPDSAGGVSPEELRKEWSALTVKKALAASSKANPLESSVTNDRGTDDVTASGGKGVLLDGIRKEHLAACGVFRARLAPLLDPTDTAQKVLVLERLKTLVGEHYAMLCMQNKVRCFQARRVLCLLQQRRPRSRSRHRSRSHSRSHSRGVVAPGQAMIAAQGDMEHLQSNHPRSGSLESLQPSRPRSAESAASTTSISTPGSSSYFRRRFWAIEEQAHAEFVEVQADGELFADTPVSSGSSHPLTFTDGGLSGLPSELLQYTQLPLSRPSSSGLRRSRPSSSGGHRGRRASSVSRVSSEGSRPSIVPPLPLAQLQLDKREEMSYSNEKASSSQATTVHPDQLALSRVQLSQTPMLGSTMQWRPAPEDVDQFVAERLQEPSASAPRAEQGQEAGRAVPEAVPQQGSSPKARRGGKTRSAPAARRGTAMAAASRRHGQRQHPGRGRAQSQPSGSPSLSPVTRAVQGERRTSPTFLSAGSRTRPLPQQKSPMNLKSASPKARRSASAGTLKSSNMPGVSTRGALMNSGSDGKMRPVTAKALRQKSPPERSSSKHAPWSAFGGPRPAAEPRRAEQLLAATKAATAYDWPPMSGAAFGLRPRSAPDGTSRRAFALARGSYADPASLPPHALPPPVVDPVAALLGGTSTLSSVDP